MTIPRHLKGVIRTLSEKGYNSVCIAQRLRTRYSFTVTPRGVRGFLQKKNEKRKPYPTLVEDNHLEYINFSLAKNPNITASELKKKISNIFHVELSLTTIKKYRRLLGWKATQTGYCQMISEKNKTFRKKWSLFMLKSYEDFKDVVFADETTVEMMSTGQFTFYNRRATIDNKPVKASKPKHSLKVHVWGGISYHGRTNVCIFSGIMDSITFQGILQENLLPFVQLRFPDGYLLYQDNDSIHTHLHQQKNGMKSIMY